MPPGPAIEADPAEAAADQTAHPGPDPGGATHRNIDFFLQQIAARVQVMVDSNPQFVERLTALDNA